MDEQAKVEFYKRVDRLEERMARAIPDGTDPSVIFVALGRMTARMGVHMETMRQAVEKMEAQNAQGPSTG